MTNFNFIDYKTKKYTFIGKFQEGLVFINWLNESVS